MLAADRAQPEQRSTPLDELVEAMDDALDDFPAYRQADVRFHIGLAEATGTAAAGGGITEAQGAMTDLISHIAHPPEVLAWSNAQHARLLAAIRAPRRRRARCSSWPSTCAAPSTCSPGFCRAAA